LPPERHDAEMNVLAKIARLAISPPVFFAVGVTTADQVVSPLE
jgi:hypothetical protein